MLRDACCPPSRATALYGPARAPVLALPIALLLVFALLPSGASTARAQAAAPGAPATSAPADSAAQSTAGAPAPTAPAAALVGRILDAQTGQPLPEARVRLVEPVRREAVSDARGEFHLAPVPAGPCVIEAVLIGYEPVRVTVSGEERGRALEVRLAPRPLPGPEIEVTTTRAKERSSAVAFTELSRTDLGERYWAQDVPMLLAETPSVYAYSDAGNGVGYSYVQIRGFAQRDVSVTINGIPLNDPQSHEVYWVDHSDLLASAQDVQVQRGVGSALYGASAVGGSINVETLDQPVDRSLLLTMGAGTYDTRRFAAQVQSGLLQNRYTFAARLSRVQSEGYREQSWSRLWSYYLSATRRDSWVTSQLNLYGGPERLHLAYYGVDRTYLDGRYTGDASQDRRFNPLNWQNETDNFFEPHTELVQNVKLGSRASLTSSAFYFPGEGYYDDFPYGPQTFASRQLPDFEVGSDSLYPAAYYATDSLGAPALQPDGKYRVVASDMTQRLWVRNRHYGWIPRARVQHDHGELTFGGEWRESVGRHWGELTWAQALPPGTDPNHVMYDYTGRVNVMSAFAQESYLLRPNLRATGSLQWRRTRYAIGKDRYQGYDFDLHYSFLDPRVGLNWNVTDRWNVFGSYAHVQDEPILSEIYSADDPTATPLFGRIDVANHIYEDPLVHPEKLNDWEAGVGFRSTRAQLKVTGFWMDFRDELVPSGAINPLGVPITANAGRSTHRGVELEGTVRHRSGLELSGNVSLSRNRFDTYRELVTDPVTGALIGTLDHSGNEIALFPDRMMNLTLGYRRSGSHAGLTLVDIGKQYLDNTEDNRQTPALRDAPGYQHLFIPEHALLNADVSLDLTSLAGRPWLGANRLSLDARVMNLTGLRYETSGYVYAEVPYFFPAARRSFFLSLTAGF